MADKKLTNLDQIADGDIGDSILAYLAYNNISYKMTAAQLRTEYLNDYYNQNLSNGEATGFPNQTDTTLSIVEGTRTFTITPTGADFSVYSEYRQITFASAQSVVWDDTEGLHYFYIDPADDTLKSTMTFVDTIILGPKVFAAYIYWDATNKEALFNDCFDERHGTQMDGASHQKFHLDFGTAYRSGLALTDIDADASGDDDTSAQFGVASGQIADEDIISNISTVASTTGLKVLYFEGANAYPRFGAITGFSVLIAGSGRLAYNQNNGGVMQQTEVGDNDYVNYHAFATPTNSDPNRMFVVQGQVVYSSANAARQGAADEIYSLTVTYLPLAEFKSIGTTIWQTRSIYTNAVKARIRSFDGEDYADFRNAEIGSGTGTSPSSHSNLTNRTDSNSHPSTAISVDATGFSGMLGPTDTDVQTALNTIDTALPDLRLSFYASLAAAVTAIGSTEVILIIDQDDILTGNLTIPANIRLQFVNGSVISGAYILTLEEPVIAGAWQIFDVATSVLFEKAPSGGFLPEWFGAAADDTVNCSPAITALKNAAVNTGGKVVFGTGTYLLEDASYFDSAVANITFIIEGQGVGTNLHISGLSGDYAFYFNETSGGATAKTFPGLRFIVRDLRVYGDSTTTGFETNSFIKLRNSYFSMTNVEATYLQYVVRATEVCDNVTFKNVEFGVQTPAGTGPVTEGSYLYYNPHSGDGIVMESCSAGPYREFNGLCKLSNANGVTFISCVNGTFDISDSSAVLFIGCHLETYKSAPGINIKNSRVAIRDSFLWSYLRNATDSPTLDFVSECDQYPIQINDSAETPANSHVSIESNTFYTPYTSATSHKIKPEIYVNPKNRSSLILRNNKSGYQRGQTKLSTTGITVASSDGALQTPLDNYRGLLASDVDIIFDAATWEVRARGGFQTGPLPALIGTSLIYTLAQQTATPPGDLAESTTFYYRIACYNLRGETVKSAEMNVTTATFISKTGAIEMNLASRAPYSICRLWRGTSADTYTHYVDIPVTSGSCIVYDTGSTLNGYLWLTSAIPTPGTVNGTTTLDNTGTPSVKGGDVWLTGGTTIITDLLDSTPYRPVTIIAEHTVTIVSATNMILSDDTDFDMLADDTLTLIPKEDGNWKEIGRSVNQTP